MPVEDPQIIKTLKCVECGGEGSCELPKSLHDRHGEDYNCFICGGKYKVISSKEVKYARRQTTKV